eukprot:4282615-Prorocentrum_lima.AAC.1
MTPRSLPEILASACDEGVTISIVLPLARLALTIGTRCTRTADCFCGSRDAKTSCDPRQEEAVLGAVPSRVAPILATEARTRPEWL